MTQSIAVGARVDASTVARLRAELIAAVDAGSGNGGSGNGGSGYTGSGTACAGDAGSEDVVLDVSAVQFVDVTGLAMLLGVRRHAERAGRRLVLRGTPRRLARLLRATRLDRILTGEESLAEGSVARAADAPAA
jgi:anti-anti-sigma regulatory factor